MKIKPNPAAGLRLYNGSRGLVPSVTEVLGVIPKPYFDSWCKDDANQKKLRDAATLGTRIHSIVKPVAEGHIESVAPDLLPYAEALQDFLRMHVKRCLGFEISQVSDRLGFGGTLDLYCQMHDGTYAVIDWKSTPSLTREHGLQLAAYALLCREHGMKVNRRIAVRIKKEAAGKFYARTYTDHKGDVEAFLALKTYWYWRHKRKIERAA